LCIPLAMLLFYRTALVRPAAIAAIRMTVQLIFVGIYLKYIFQYNNMWLNILWVLVMMVVAAATIGSRSELKHKYFLLPVLVGVLAGVSITESVFLFAVLDLENVFDARYFVPVSGMILGNCLQSSIIGMKSFYYGLHRDENIYKYYLACGASRNEALLPFMQEALKNSFNPAIATMATIGLISLPGMMTGQILGGSLPLTAIKYQIMIMIAIFSGTVINVTTGINISKYIVFDQYDILKRNVSSYR